MDKSITDAQGNDEKMPTQGTEAAVNGTTQDQVAYYVQRREGHSGPHTVSALRDLLATGEIWENSLVWREGMSKWEPYAQVFHVTPTPPPLQPPTRENDKDKGTDAKSNLPFDTMSDTQQLYHVNASSGSAGPYTLDSIKKMVQNGQLSADVQVCLPGEQNWVPPANLQNEQKPDMPTVNTLRLIAR